MIKNRRSLIGALVRELVTTKRGESKRRDPPSMGKQQEKRNSSQENYISRVSREKDDDHAESRSDREGDRLVISRTPPESTRVRGLGLKSGVDNQPSSPAASNSRDLSQKAHIVAQPHNSPGAHARTRVAHTNISHVSPTATN